MANPTSSGGGRFWRKNVYVVESHKTRRCSVNTRHGGHSKRTLEQRVFVTLARETDAARRWQEGSTGGFLMSDTDERLDRIERTLGSMNSSMNEQLGEIRARLDQGDNRFGQMDQRFGKIDERFVKIDERFAKIDERFNQVDERFNQVDERFEAMDERIDSLASDVHKLRVLEEVNSGQIKVIAEVQSRHGEKLDELVKAVEPLHDLRDFVKRVAGDHERRITALEKKT
jgi:archaellum component FlaC